MPPDPLHSNEYVTLRDYFERLLLEHNTTTRDRLADERVAREKAANNLDLRMAEFREYKDQLREQTGNLVTLSALEAKLDVLRADIGTVKTSLRGVENNQSNTDNRMWAIGGGVLIINIVLIAAVYILGR